MCAPSCRPSETPAIPILDLWKKYEEIAMHFNDLIMKVRTQSLGGVALIATLVSVLSKDGEDGSVTWGAVTGVFFFMVVFWLALFLVDFLYYNRLLNGAVVALLLLENRSKNGERAVNEIY